MLFVSTIYTYQQIICYSLQTMQIIHHTLIISKNYFARQKKKIWLHSQLDFNDRCYMHGQESQVKQRGRKGKRLQLNISLLVSIQYPWKYLAFRWHYRRKHPRILYLCNQIGNRWTSSRIQYFLIVLIHWEKSVKQPQKQVSEVSKTTFLPIKLQ